MRNYPAGIDEGVTALLSGWEHRLGPPTCGSGCPRCCETSVIVTSAPEVLLLLDYLQGEQPDLYSSFKVQWEVRGRHLRRELERGVDLDTAIEAAELPAACLFLRDGRCSVYPGRPITCRIFHVWHPSSLCGRPDYQMCCPAELRELGVNQTYELLLGEVEKSRIPFWGSPLWLMAWLIDSHREAYECGENMAKILDPIWEEKCLLHFFDQAGDCDTIRGKLNEELRDWQTLFREEPWPRGQPKAAEVTGPEELAAFALDLLWLEDRANSSPPNA